MHAGLLILWIKIINQELLPCFLGWQGFVILLKLHNLWPKLLSHSFSLSAFYLHIKKGIIAENLIGILPQSRKHLSTELNGLTKDSYIVGG